MSIRRSLRNAAWSGVRPRDEERDEIHRIIMEELVAGVIKPEAIAYHQASDDADEESGLRCRWCWGARRFR